MSGVVAGGEVGNVFVVTTNNRGMNPDEMADLAINKILNIADTTPMPLREQAYAFREQIREVILHYFNKVAAAERRTIAAKLRQEGLPHIADKIEDLR
jgi:hypothetical protein